MSSSFLLIALYVPHLTSPHLFFSSPLFPPLHAFPAETYKFLSPEQEQNQANFIEKETGQHLEVIEKEPTTDWLAVAYKTFGCQLEFVTNLSQEGSQFCRGFGGIGGILRYQLDFTELA